MAGGLKDPLTNWNDQPPLLSQGDEVSRKNHATLRMPPPDQRLGARDAITAQIKLRLQVNFKLGAFNCLA